MASIFGMVISGSFSGRKKLEEAANDIERAVRFSVDEAALRNSIVRVHFLLDELPQEYAVEYGPNDNFVLPTPITAPSENLSERDQELLLAETKKLNKNFNKIREFQDKNKTIPDTIRIIGIGTEQNEFLQTDFHASLYLYPTGEKDSAIILLASNEELISLTIDPFTMDIEREYRALENDNDEEIEQIQNNLAQELYKIWLKK